MFREVKIFYSCSTCPNCYQPNELVHCTMCDKNYCNDCLKVVGYDRDKLCCSYCKEDLLSLEKGKEDVSET